MFTYETPRMTAAQCSYFNKIFDKIIGTETETTVVDNSYYVTCFELEYDEIEEAANIWKTVTK